MNLNRLKKSEILWLYNHFCRHKHRYTEHIKCYLTEKPAHSPIQEKIATFDIETSNLKATFGIVFSYAFLQADGKILGRAITPNEIRRGIYDKKLLQELVEDMQNQDTVITWFGKYFDIPFVRTRCLHYGIKFPEHKSLRHIDLWKTCKDKLKLHSNRLQVCCDFLGVKSKGHPIKSHIWFDAMGGKKKALDYIFKHNTEDVESTMMVYNKLLPYISNLKGSI